LEISAFFLAFLIFIPVGTQRSHTILPTDPYWRYQGQLWAQKILETRYISPAPFPRSGNVGFLVAWANRFFNNILAPLIVAVVSIVTDISTVELQVIPLFILTIVISQILIARVIVKHPTTPIIAVFIAVSYKFLAPQFVVSPHRGALAWALFLSLISWILIVQDPKRQLYGVAIIVLVLPFSAKTLSVIGMVFVSLIFAVSNFVKGQKFSFVTYTAMLLYIVTYNGIINSGLWDSAKKIIFAVGAQIQLIIEQSLFDVLRASWGGFINVQTTPLSNFLLNTSIPSQIFFLTLYVSVLSLLFAAFTSLYRVMKIYSEREIFPIDIVWIATLGQGIIMGLVAILFAGSGGLNYRLLGLTFAPIFGSFTILKLSSKIRSNWRLISVALVVLLIVFLPAFSLMIQIPDTPGYQFHTTANTEQHSVDWIDTYTSPEDSIVSDFASLSVFYTLSDNQPYHKSYLPATSTLSYTTNKSAERLISTYYEKPSNAPADLWLVNRRMETNGLFHIGSIKTKPNPNLSNDLDISRDWQIIYTSKHNKMYKNK
jgi:hypothetical protein